MGLLLLKLKARLSTAPVVILIRGRKAVALKRTVPASVLTAFSDIAGAYSIDEAMITVCNSGGSDIIRFFGKVPDTAKQRFRNIWFSFPQRKITGI